MLANLPVHRGTDRQLPDDPALDTLVLAMSISRKDALLQYVGRISRKHNDRSDIRIYDFGDSGRPAVPRIWEQRQKGYLEMGYRMTAAAVEGRGRSALEL